MRVVELFLADKPSGAPTLLAKHCGSLDLAPHQTVGIHATECDDRGTNVLRVDRDHRSIDYRSLHANAV